MGTTLKFIFTLLKDLHLYLNVRRMFAPQHIDLNYTLFALWSGGSLFDDLHSCLKIAGALTID